MAIDKNGDVIYAGADLDYYKAVKIDKDTKTGTAIVEHLDSALSWPYHSTLSLAIDPVNEDIFGLYSVPGIWGFYIYDMFVIYKLEKQGDGYYSPMNHIVSQQVFEDSDVDPYAEFPFIQLTAPANGFAVDPGGEYLYITNCNYNDQFYYYAPESSNIIRILTRTPSRTGNAWQMYE
ncbi:hypothetical protein JW926_14600 [Candidatus Sumerlaeota bacterium]|nr:hypothetical protein [Candidatus Sumerlaeota bacterium]